MFFFGAIALSENGAFDGITNLIEQIYAKACLNEGMQFVSHQS